jgi:hypothetical protein
MVVALYLIALAMIAGGAGAIYLGWDIVVIERGWTMVICGTIALSGGLLLFGLAVVAGRIRRIERELSVFRDNLMQLGGSVSSVPMRSSEPLPVAGGVAGGPVGGAVGTPDEDPGTAPTEAPIAGEEEQAVLKAADAIPEPALPEAPGPAPEAQPEPAQTVVGTYSSGGNAYTMYADGSIEADTPTGRYRFKSLDELKDFIASGGEDGAARGT